MMKTTMMHAQSYRPHEWRGPSPHSRHSPLPLDGLWERDTFQRHSMGERVAHGEGVEMLQGTLDLLVLKTLSWGPAHGYGIARWIQQVTNDVLRVEEGSLYPALHRLAKRGW